MRKFSTCFPLSASTFIFSLFFFFFFSTSSLLLGVSAVNLSVASHPSKLQLPLGDPVEGSPGSRPGSAVTCNRIHILGHSRLRHLDKFAHALKIRVSISQGDALFRIQTVELCFHNNASIEIGMCPSTQWEKLSKGSWTRSVSPFGNRILDIRMLPDPSRSIDVSTEEEFLPHRVVFLVVGLVLMLMARGLSESVVFYYGSAMTVGVILVILIILFQGMKLLPTGRRSSFAIVLYSSIVGVATFLLRYLSGLFRTILLEIGVSEDMHNPLGMFLLVCLVLAGAWFGYWSVRKLVLTDGGSVDPDVAYFVEWAILIFAAVMVSQSSLDTLLAAEALAFTVMLTAIARTCGKWRCLRRVLKKMFRIIQLRRDQGSPSKYSSGYSDRYQDSGSKLHRAHYSRVTPSSPSTRGFNNYSPQALVEQDSFYSTFHRTPERKKFSKEEWEEFTKSNTKEGLTELVSTPDFHKWAIDNADRITLTPPQVTNHLKKRRLFRWF